ncbi:AI-2E family transporter [Curtobacterium sp. 314Chir4.1]|uniref:AI-2E family transporter n=1 Tax=Curtobacterium sp. 314Chir4.1 TaxID=1279028 RepID=UPI001596923B|nr:AI-2E family transporter [Curtobacterium sp. 314Chir4.1]
MVGLAAAVVIAIGCVRFSSIIGPTALALVVTICVQPARVFLERLGLARGFASAVVIVIVLALTVGFSAALVVSFAQFATLFPQYSEQFQQLERNVADALERVGVGQEQVSAVFATFDPGQIVGAVSNLIGSVFGFGLSTVVVLSLIVFMTLDAGWGHLIAGRLRPVRPGLVDALVGYTLSVRRYMLVTALLGAVVAALDALALAILGIPGALLWGLLAFITGFIPNIGYWIGIIPPVFIALLANGWANALAVIIIYAVINGVIQSGLQPHIVGSAVSLNQTISFLSVVVWSALLGPLGAILALPLTLIVRALLVDANPDARWVRPVLGDLEGLKVKRKKGTVAP